MAADALPILDDSRCLHLLTRGEVLLLPVDTLFGLACRADSGSAVDRLYHLKGRAPSKAISLAFGTLTALETMLEPEPRLLERLSRLLPGPVTVVMPTPVRFARRFPRWKDTVGVRVPGPSPASSLLNLLEWPLALSSANLSGAADMMSVDELDPGLVDGIAGRLAGSPPLARGSSVIRLDASGWNLLRAGACSLEELTERLGEPS